MEKETIVNKNYKIKVNVERGRDIYLAVTHNGRQWNSINIKDPKYEIPLIITALRSHLPNAMHSDGRAEISDFCADCKDEFGHPDNCKDCPNDPHYESSRNKILTRQIAV